MKIAELQEYADKCQECFENHLNDSYRPESDENEYFNLR
jgi:hypothetical protein